MQLGLPAGGQGLLESGNQRATGAPGHEYQVPEAKCGFVGGLESGEFDIRTRIYPALFTS